MIKKSKKVCRILNCIEHLLNVISSITRCFSLSVLAYLVGTAIGIMSSAVRLKICGRAVGIKKYKSLIEKKKKKAW